MASSQDAKPKEPVQGLPEPSRPAPRSGNFVPSSAPALTCPRYLSACNSHAHTCNFNKIMSPFPWALSISGLFRTRTHPASAEPGSRTIRLGHVAAAGQ